MLDILRFWLDRGVDGFRVDALRQVLKDPALRDNPPNPAFGPGCRSTTRCCRSAAPTPRTSSPVSRDGGRRSPPPAG